MTLTNTLTNTPVPTLTRVPAKILPTLTATLSPSPSPSPTLTPTFTPTVAGQEHGLTDIRFSLRKISVAPDEEIWFDFAVTNESQATLGCGLLGAEVTHGDGSLFFIQPSLKDGVLLPEQVLTKADNFTISAPGSYRAQLIICYNKLNICNSSGEGWERLSPIIPFEVYIYWTPTMPFP
jgi:hypothetical protein